MELALIELVAIVFVFASTLSALRTARTYSGLPPLLGINTKP